MHTPEAPKNTHYHYKEKPPAPWMERLQVGVHVATLAGVIVGLFALFSADKNIRTFSRSQLYENDYDFIKLKVSNPEWKAWSIYSHADKTDPALYCQAMLKTFSSKPEVFEIKSAQALYKAYTDGSTYGNDERNKDMAEFRRAYSLCSALLDGMHQAYDLKEDGVIKQGELDTWMGYIDAIGPHPVFLSAIVHWHDSHFMTRGFAKELIYRLTEDPRNPDAAKNKAIVDRFYGEMLKGDFLSNLPQQ